ncbi:uncharacterized protein LOC131233938 [Magnolia sinica]|uniref:uncharacterized protein LOC131233938 n=1 Tax=Magnolia sinica TaxID=86752 RepID=UPI00265A2C76|nr:uncharacterized protein LOC131233938 [Magnolia sinica]XP_058086808.1 uncharacterized protein LOC131233938 [Magnolia sinica]
MASQHYRSQFGDTTFTKVFVGGLAWETPTEEMRRYFEQFGEILEAVIITDKNTGRSKGYGFVTYRDPESARRACIDPNPVIDGRRANCNIASLGRPRPSPPRGRNQGGISYHGGAPATSYGRVVAPPPPPPPLLYPPYGYATYTPEYGYPQAVYNPQIPPQYYQQMYGTSSSAGGPYHYAAHGGYSFHAAGASFSAPQGHRIQPPPFLHYPAQGEGSVTPPQHPYPFPPPAPLRQQLPVHDLQTHQQPSTTTTTTTTTTTATAATSGNSDTFERGAS